MKISITRYPLLIALIVLSFCLRLYRVTNEPLDWHAWRQADTASVTRDFVQNGIDLLRPTYHDISSIPSGLPNPDGWRMVEFPFVNALVAGLVLTIPGSDIEVMSRLVSNLFATGAMVSLFFFVLQLTGQKHAYLSALVFATLPFSVFYGRAILPEPALLFFTTTALLLFQRWLASNNWRWCILSAVFLALALLLKPFALFMAPVFLTLLLVYRKQRFWKEWGILTLFGVTALLPLFLWRTWIEQFPAGVPASDWLFNGNGIRLRPAWFRWLGYERITKLILGFAGLLPVAIGGVRLLLTAKKGKGSLVYLSWLASIGLYFIVIATGNIQHDYYQVFALPILAVTVAYGLIEIQRYTALWFTKLLKKYHSDFSARALASQVGGLAVIGTIYGITLLLSWSQVAGYFNINHHEYIRAGLRVQALTPTDALVIAPALGDTQFLYATNRHGWPIGGNIEEKIQAGATHYVTTAMDDEALLLESRFFVIEKTDEYLLLDLTKEKSSL